jgi:hypothetical protein
VTLDIAGLLTAERLTDVPILFSLLRVSNPGPIRLVEYPWVVVRLARDGCKRQGTYGLARLSERFGAEAEIEHGLDRLASDCIARGQGEAQGRRAVPGSLPRPRSLAAG